MPIFSLTADAHVQNLARDVGDLLPTAGTATAVTGSTTTLTIAGQIGALAAGSLIGSEIYTVSGTGSGQTLRITGHTVSAGTATLTFPTATALDGTTVFYVVRLGGRGYQRQQYLDAINAAVDSANSRTFTDLSNVSMAIERGDGGVTQEGLRRYEYPMPSGFLYLWALDLLRSSPIVRHGIGFLNTQRAFGDAAGRTRVGQGFQFGQQALVAYIAVFMGKVLAPTDDLTCVVETNSAGIPSGTAVTNGTSATVGGATVQTRFRHVVFTFSPPMMLLENTTYHLTLRRSGAADAANYYIVGEDDGNNYSLGALSVRDAANWTAVSGSDLLFAISPQADWAPLAQSLFDYKPQNTDQLLIRGDWAEGRVIQLRGGAAIARPATATTEVPLEPDYVQQYALWHLKGNRAGMPVPENGQMGAATVGQRWPMIQHPARPFPADTRRIW